MTRALARGLAAAMVASVWTAATAGAGAPRWVEDAVSAAVAPPAGGAGAVVLYDRTDIRLDERLRTQVRRRRVARVLASDGVAAAMGFFHIEPGGSIRDARSWILGPDGLRGTAGRSELIETQLYGESYTDIRLFALPATGARPGDVVAFEAEWDESEAFPMHAWYPQPGNLPVVRSELELKLPEGWSAEVHGYHLATPPASPQGETVRVTLSDLARLPDEPLRPVDSALLPRVVVRYVDPGRRLALLDWKRVAAFASELMGPSAAPSACPAPLAPASMSGEASAKVRDLARSVQHGVRYVAIELGMARWVPDRAEATWTRRYGDCKDKAALLVSALAANGIEARLVLVGTRDRWRVDPASPDLFQFNHVIVAIAWPGPGAPAPATLEGPSGRRWTLFDPTDADTPLGEISDQLGETWGVIVDAGEGLVRLPPPSPVRLSREVRGRLDPRGDLTGRVTLLAGGPAGPALLARYGPHEPAERKRRASEFLRSRWPSSVVDSCWLAVATGEEPRPGVHISFRLPAVARPVGRSWLLTPSLLSSWLPAPSRDSLRTLPLSLGSRGRVEESWIIELPEGLAAESRPPVEWKAGFADYLATARGDGATLTIRRELDLRAAEIPASEFATGRSFWRAVYSGDRPAILLDPK